MTINDFIIMTLNISADHVESFNPRKVDGVIYLDITLKPTHPECPYCGGNVVSKGFSEHRYNHLSYGGFPTVIVWKRRRYKCKDCGKSFSEENPFGPENFHQTYALLDDIAKALHSVNATYKDIGERYGVSPTLIQLYMDSFVQAPRMRLPENLGIDEIYSKTLSKYGGSYLCVLVDNNGRQLNDILPNRSKNELSKYFEKIPQAERDNVKYVTIDMWDTYKNVCNKYLRNAEIAVDPFHVIEHLTKGFSRIRIDIMNQAAKNTPTYYLLKSWHRLLETDKIPLDNEPQYNGFFHQKMNRRELYEMTLNLNPDLKEAYELKEMYRDFNKKCSLNHL